jgi:hypothetical protein
MIVQSDGGGGICDSNGEDDEEGNLEVKSERCFQPPN